MKKPKHKPNEAYDDTHRVSELIERQIISINNIEKNNTIMMMQTSELRIGNWVEGYDGKHFQISLYEFYLMHKISADADEICKPIALTEEWLLKFGWKHTNTLHAGEFVYTKKSSLAVYLKDGIARFAFKTDKIDSVHMFQNAIKVLTGTELTLQQNGLHT